MPLSPRMLVPRTGFTPKSISGLSLWLDASDASTITISTGVSVWADKSGNGRDATQSTGGKQPINSNILNGRKVVTFQGTDDTMQIQASAAFNAVSQTLIVIANQTSGADELIWHKSSSAGANGLMVRFRLDRLWVFSNESITPQIQALHSAGWSPTDHNIFSVVMEPAAQSLHVNGISRGTNTVSATYEDNTTVWLGSRRDVSTFLNGNIAEVLHWGRALSAAERQQVERYLGNKWGISVT